MKEMLRYGLILGMICLVASGLLAGVNSLTQKKIAAQAEAEEGAGLKEVLPQAARFEEVKQEGKVVYYKAFDQDNNLIGAAFKTSAKGYSSEIQAVAGINKEGAISAIKIISQNETPGMGSQVAEPSFTAQFAGKDINKIEEVEAITGATISSTAVISSVKKKAAEVYTSIK